MTRRVLIIEGRQEGYKTSNTVKILVVPNENDIEQVQYNGEILATVSPGLSSDGIPVFRPEDIREIVNLLVQQLRGKERLLPKSLFPTVRNSGKLNSAIFL